MVFILLSGRRAQSPGLRGVPLRLLSAAVCWARLHFDPNYNFESVEAAPSGDETLRDDDWPPWADRVGRALVVLFAVSLAFTIAYEIVVFHAASPNAPPLQSLRCQETTR